MECLPNTKVSNIYGPTETNIVTYFHINEKIPESWESVPIGKPVHDTEIYIVDEDLKMLPPGEVGEIFEFAEEQCSPAISTISKELVKSSYKAHFTVTRHFVAEQAIWVHSFLTETSCTTDARITW